MKHASVYHTGSTRCVAALVTECPVSQGRITFRRSIVNIRFGWGGAKIRQYFRKRLYGTGALQRLGVSDSRCVVINIGMRPGNGKSKARSGTGSRRYRENVGFGRHNRRKGSARHIL